MNIIDERNTIFFDMDGVLAIYERNAYTSRSPLFLNKKKHYFRTCERDDSAYSILRSCIAGGVDTYVLSKAPKGYDFIKRDKIIWLQDFVPEIAPDHILIAESDKAELVLVEKQIKKLNKRMILIDDFNQNLLDWEKRGGTAVKYINNINNEKSFDGMKLYKSALPASI